jgi:MFS family permease
MITAATLGYDSSMMNGLNILTVYTDYFKLTTATNSTNTAAIYIGHVIAAFVVGSITDRWGRINTLFWSAASAIVGVALQTGAVNIAMFIVGRIIIGFGTGMAACAGPTYLSEATGYRFRAIALGMFFDFFFVGKWLSRRALHLGA